MKLKLSFLFHRRAHIADRKRLQVLKDFSLAAPLALDLEQLSDAIELLELYDWDAMKAALHFNNRALKDFDDAMLEEGDDPFGDLESDAMPGPSG